jgi:hypothetical protein
MRSNIIFTIMLLSVNVIVFSQPGYKNFRFGMSLNEIQQMNLEDFSESSHVGQNISDKVLTVISYFNNYVHGSYIISPPVGSFIYDNHYNAWNSDWEYHFFLYEDRLRFVYIYNRNTITIDDLKKQYGSPFIWERSNNETFYLFTNDRDRYVLERKEQNRGYLIHDEIYFIDRDWADNLCLSYFREYRKEQEERKANILD